MAFDTKFLEDLAKTEVTEHSSYFKPRTRAATVLLTGFEQKTAPQKVGDGFFVNMLVLGLETAPEAVAGNSETNYVGENVCLQYFPNDGSKDKQNAVKGALIKDAVSVFQAFTGSNDSLASIKGSGKKLGEALDAYRDCRGVIMKITARDTANKAGEPRTYHNLVAVPNKLEEIKKRRELLAKGAPISAYI